MFRCFGDGCRYSADRPIVIHRYTAVVVMADRSLTSVVGPLLAY